ncbi:MAG: hypothetical protein K8W52_14800 [Deltaproteobacteria bacterium]|nr:hypothetical protein [Deltaproteobacteria bacterium]
MKKKLETKKLVLTARTIAVIDLSRASGGMMDPTLGVCGDSRGRHCPTYACG